MLRTETVERSIFELLNTLMHDNALRTFNLVGGTALSLYMGHRKSIDLDMFSIQSFNSEDIRTHLVSRYDLKIDDFYKATDMMLLGFIKGVKVDCVHYNYPLVKPVVEIDGIRMLSVYDIAAMKLAAISQSGNRLKDFVDMAYLSTQMSLEDIIESFEKKYPNTNSIGAIKGITYYNDIDFTVKIDMINSTFSWKRIEKRLTDMVKYPERLFLEAPL